jgi:glucokinase
MFSKPLIVAALVGGASAFDVVTVTHNKNLECGPCILGGYNFCTLKATMSYYSKLTAAYTRDQNTAVCCPVGKTECKNTADDTVVNNSALWTCYNLPSATTATNAYSF